MTRPAYLDDDTHRAWAAELDRLVDVFRADLPAANASLRRGGERRPGERATPPARRPAAVQLTAPIPPRRDRSMATTKALRHYGHQALELAARIEADHDMHVDCDDLAAALVVLAAVDALRREGNDLLTFAARRDAIDAALAVA